MKKRFILLFASMIFLVSCGSDSQSVNSADLLFDTTNSQTGQKDTSRIPQNDTNNAPQQQDSIKQPVVADNRKKIVQKKVVAKKPVAKKSNKKTATKQSTAKKSSQPTKKVATKKSSTKKSSTKKSTAKKSVKLIKSSNPNTKK